MGKQQTRRKSLLIRLALLAIFLVSVHQGPAAMLPRGIAEARTPSTMCIPGRVTPSVTEGPFYKTGSPQRGSCSNLAWRVQKTARQGQASGRDGLRGGGAWWVSRRAV